SQPPPTAAPLTAAITGTLHNSIRSQTACPRSAAARAPASSSPASSAMSVPALKLAAPAPVKITARRSVRAVICVNNSASRSSSARESALRLAGRLSVTSVNGPRSSMISSGFKSLQVHRLWILRIAVVIEAAPCLAPVETGEDHTIEERRRGEAALAEFCEHDLGDVVGCVEADEIKERQRSHRVAAAEFHR